MCPRSISDDGTQKPPCPEKRTGGPESQKEDWTVESVKDDPAGDQSRKAIISRRDRRRHNDKKTTTYREPL